MKIIVDMMGGDNAPLAVLEGAAAAVKEYGVQLRAARPANGSPFKGSCRVSD